MMGVFLLLNVHYVAAVRFSHTVTEDTTWYYQQLTTEPSLIVEIEFSIVCLDGPGSIKFNLYTTEDNVKLQKNCSFEAGSQLHNGNMWVPLRPQNKACRKNRNGLLYCTGKTVIQDFKPRRISFSFGNSCESPDRNSLKGLSFNISASGLRNRTDCNPIHWILAVCSEFYSSISFPNLLGYQEPEAIYTSAAAIMSWLNNQEIDGCYKFLLEILCYIFSPKCDVTRGVTIPLCRENCWDFMNGCERLIRKKVIDYTSDIKDFLNCDYLPTMGGDVKCFYKAVTCDAPQKIHNGKIEGGAITIGTYPLHSQLTIMCVNETFIVKGNRTISCEYSGKWSQIPKCTLRACPAPPTVEHAHIEEHHHISEGYPWHTQLTYICDNKTFHMEGNSTITCLKNEHWSPAPACIEIVPDIIYQNKLKTLEIALPTVVIVLITVITGCFLILYKRKLKLKHNILPSEFTLDSTSLTRIKKYDAFVCYQFDADDDFVKNTIIPELEQNHDPPFKLCIHDREFVPGTLVLDNMQVGIENSNSAILVMSQAFVDSMWCQQEFQYSHIEHMKDPAFKLFIIIMQPIDSLRNLTECMKQYFVQETYLKKDDEKLFRKIASYLTLVKQPKDEGGTPGGTEVNPDGKQQGQGDQENEEGIPIDVPGDDDTDDNDNGNDFFRNADIVVHHYDENNSYSVMGENDVTAIFDDVINDDENVPLLVE